MIPKIIHYCWFGNANKSKLIKKCLESWRQYCPDYEIIEWNETNFDINICEYVKIAYFEKKWAFVSDYARHYILNKYGGIYLDTDVELLTSLDPYIGNAFIALENKDSIASGLIMGCEKNNWFCKEILKTYEEDDFANDLLKKVPLTVCERTTKIFSKYGFKHKNELQSVNGFLIYPTEFFCPIDPITYEKKITENTVSIHHYGGSWCSSEQKEYLLLRAKYAKILPKNIASLIATFYLEKRKNGFVKGLLNTSKKIFDYLIK